MLQMWTAGQNVVGGHQLTVYNGDGSLAATLSFPPSPGGDVANGANQATILIGTAEAQTFFGVTMDLLISPLSTTGQGLQDLLGRDVRLRGHRRLHRLRDGGRVALPDGRLQHASP